MIHAITIHYRGATVNDGSFRRADWVRLMAYAWEQVGRKWHLEMRPKHFTKQGALEYYYEPRQGEQTGTSGKRFWSSYTGRKLKKFGHTLPLVWSGETRAASGTAKITATSRGVRIAYAGMPPIHMYKPKTRRRSVQDDFLYVSPAEITELNRHFQIVLARALRSYNRSSTRRIGR
jgi:hypothetical protein